MIMLPERDGEKFFEIALPMLTWVKKRNKKSKSASKQAWRDKYFDAKEARTVWIAIWERPELIDKYIRQKGGGLSEETKRVLSDWRENFVPGPFIMERYLDDGTVFVSIRDGRVYLVSGITSPIGESLDAEHLSLPCQVKTSLIPFMGRVIYDGTIEAEADALVPEAARILDQIFQDAKRNGELIRRLPSDVPPPDVEQWRNILQTLISQRKQTKIISQKEFFHKASSVPDMRILSKRDLSVLDKMLDKPRRTDKDWDKIKDILLDADLFTIEPPAVKPAVKRFRVVDGVLCEDDTLMAFTSLEKCQAYIKKLSKKLPGRYYGINIISFEALMETAKRDKTQVVIDNPDHIFETFFLYDSETERISVSFRIPDINP